MPAFTDAELLSQVQRLEELREALLASREHSLKLTANELLAADYFHYPKRDLYVPIWGANAASRLADVERRLLLLRAELVARHEDGGET